MMRNIAIALSSLVLATTVWAQPGNGPMRGRPPGSVRFQAEKTDVSIIKDELLHQDNVMMVSNQGDWHGTTANSLHALQKAFEKGAKIAFVTLQQTKDGQIVLFSGPDVSAVTGGSGKTSSYTLAELRALPLLEYGEVAGYEAVPTLEEALAFCKDKLILGLDPGKLSRKAVRIIRSRNAFDGVIFTDRSRRGFMYLPTLDLDDSDALSKLPRLLGKNPVAVQVHFKEDSCPRLVPALEMMKGKCRICVNTTDPSLAGGRKDASPRDDAEAVWGELIAKGATIIVTDQTKGLMNYLLSRNGR